MITEYGIYLGPLLVYWYAIIIVSGAILALLIATHEAKRFNVETETMFDLFFVMMICGFIGARIYYVAFEWEMYRDNLLQIFNFRAGGIAIYGGIIGGALGAFFYTRRKHLNFYLLLDIVAPVLLLAQSIGRWGNFMNKEAYGAIVPGATVADQAAYLKQFFIPDFIVERMFINGNYHQPTFLYESLWTFIGFILLYFVIRKLKGIRVGTIAASYLVWYGIGRAIVEGMRIDSLYIFNTIRVSQALSGILVVVGILILIYIYLHKKSIPLYTNAKLLLYNKEESGINTSR